MILGKIVLYFSKNLINTKNNRFLAHSDVSEPNKIIKKNNPLQILVDSYNLLMHNSRGRESFTLYCSKSARSSQNLQTAQQALRDKELPMKIKLNLDNLQGEKEEVSLNELHWGITDKNDLKISLEKLCGSEELCRLDSQSVSSRCIHGGNHYTVFCKEVVTAWQGDSSHNFCFLK